MEVTPLLIPLKEGVEVAKETLMELLQETEQL